MVPLGRSPPTYPIANPVGHPGDNPIANSDVNGSVDPLARTQTYVPAYPLVKRPVRIPVSTSACLAV